MRINDLVTLDAKDSRRQVLPNGFVRIPAKIGRVGIQTYSAHELGVTDRAPTDVIRVLRLPEEVFKPESMATFGGVAVTDDHPPEDVTAENWATYARGWSDSAVGKADDGQHVETWVTLAAKDLISKADGGKVELSNGYDCLLEWGAGVHATFGAYDAVQRNIAGNHIAVVDAGRCGQSCRLADGPATPTCDCQTKERAPMADIQTKTVMVDGLPVVTTDAGEIAINLLRSKLGDAANALTSLQAKHDTEVAAHQVTKDALAVAEKKAADAVITPAILDAAVAKRAQLITDAKRLLPTLDAAGKTDDAIRAEAVTAKLGDAAKDKDAAYMAVAFDTLLTTAPAAGDPPTGADPLRDTMLRAQPLQAADARDKAWQDSNDALTNAWKTPAAA